MKNQYDGKDIMVHACNSSGWVNEGKEFLNRVGRFFSAVREADKGRIGELKRIATY